MQDASLIISSVADALGLYALHPFCLLSYYLSVGRAPLLQLLPDSLFDRLNLFVNPVWLAFSVVD